MRTVQGALQTDNSLKTLKKTETFRDPSRISESFTKSFLDTAVSIAHSNSFQSSSISSRDRLAVSHDSLFATQDTLEPHCRLNCSKHRTSKNGPAASISFGTSRDHSQSFQASSTDFPATPQIPSRSSQDPTWAPEETSKFTFPTLRNDDPSWKLHRSRLKSLVPSRTSELPIWTPLVVAPLSLVPSQTSQDPTWTSHDSPQHSHFPSRNSQAPSKTLEGNFQNKDSCRTAREIKTIQSPSLTSQNSSVAVPDFQQNSQDAFLISSDSSQTSEVPSQTTQITQRPSTVLTSPEQHLTQDTSAVLLDTALISKESIRLSSDESSSQNPPLISEETDRTSQNHLLISEDADRTSQNILIKLEDTDGASQNQPIFRDMKKFPQDSPLGSRDMPLTSPNTESTKDDFPLASKEIGSLQNLPITSDAV